MTTRAMLGRQPRGGQVHRGEEEEVGEVGVGDPVAEQPGADLARVLRLPREGGPGIRRRRVLLTRTACAAELSGQPAGGPPTGSLTYQQIQELAATHAHSVETTAATRRATVATAADATGAEVATPAENLPGEEAVAAAMTMDWSFLDMMNEGFHPMIDEFGYGHFMAPSTMGPTDGAAEEGAGGGGTSSLLWNF